MSAMLKSLPGTWQDKIIFAIGAFVFVSPWLLLYSGSPVAAWNAWVIGVAFMGGAALAMVYEPYWPEFGVAFTAFWHVLAPRILGYGGETLTAATAVATGAIVVYLALWAAIARANKLHKGETVAAGRPGPQHPATGRPAA